MNSLPRYWIVKDDGSSLFDNIINYLNRTYNRSWGGEKDCYYGYDGNRNAAGTDKWDTPSKFKNNPTILSIEEFIELSKEIEEFPEKFSLAGGFDLKNSKIWKEFTKDFIGNASCYYYCTQAKCIGYEENLRSEYPLITLQEFEKYFENPMETKEIIGYKLKDQSLRKAASLILNGYDHGMNLVDGANMDIQSAQVFKDAGVLELLFEPVYKEEKYPLSYSELKSNEFYCCEYERQGIYIFQHNNKFWMNSNKEVNSHSDGEFKPSNGFHKFRKATTEEIEEILLLEAKERYPIGCKIKLMSKNTGGDFDNKVKFTKYQIYDNGKQIYIDGNLLLYENGKWAEILPSYPQIAINSYKGEFFDNYVKFGCAEISKQVFIDLYQLNQSIRNGDMAICRDSNREIVSATIGTGTFSKEQIKEIAEYYLQNK